MALKKGLVFIVLSVFTLLGENQAALALSVEKLPGYSRVMVGQAFVDWLTANPEVLKALANNETLSREVMRNASMQSQLMQGKTTLAEMLPRLQAEQAKTEQVPQPPPTTKEITTPPAHADARLAAIPLTQEKVMLSQDIAANLIVANEVANNPALARYFERHPEAYKKVRDGELRLEDISLAPAAPEAVSVTGKNDVLSVKTAKLHEPAHLETETSCIGFDIRFKE